MKRFIFYLIAVMALSAGMMFDAPLPQADDEPLVCAQIDVQDYQPQGDLAFEDFEANRIIGTLETIETIETTGTLGTAGTLETIETTGTLETAGIVGYIDQFRLCGGNDNYDDVFVGFMAIKNIPIYHNT
jgi:hypothetical protein